jgi:hypothetical protein
LRLPSRWGAAATVTARTVPVVGLVVALAALTVHQNRERTAEALAYGELEQRLPPFGGGVTDIVVIGGPFAGPFHALYLQAMADTRYGTGATTVRWLPAGTAPPDGPFVVRWPLP